jgi:hypothetical protein
MYKRISLILALLALVVVLVACGPSFASDAGQLAFEAPMNVDSGARFHVSLGVRNVGDGRYRDYGAFNGKMELRDDAGGEVGRIQVATLWELAPGNAGWPAAYVSKLPAGAYQLTWGAPEHGSVAVDFTIIELEGRLYLGEESIQGTAGETPDDGREYGALQHLVDLARVNLSQRLGVPVDAVSVEDIREAEFPDASLGAPEPDEVYAQVLTPGYVIELAAGGDTHEYHASDERLVFAPQEGAVPQGQLTIEAVKVVEGERIVVRGSSTLPDGTCLGSELWAGGELQNWWPGEACVPVAGGTWEMIVPLGEAGAPPALEPAAQYMLRAFQHGGPNVVATFAFDLAGPPTPAP